MWVHVNCKCKYPITSPLRAFQGIIYNTGCTADCLSCSLQVVKDWVMIPPYSTWVWKWDRPLHRALRALLLWRVCGFFNVPQIYYMCKGLWDGAYSLSSLSEKTRKSNRLRMLLQRQQLSPHPDPGCWSGRGLDLRSPAQQTGAYSIELTGMGGGLAWSLITYFFIPSVLDIRWNAAIYVLYITSSRV